MYYRQVHRDRKWNRGYKGLRRGENGELLFNGYRVSLGDDEIVLQMDSGGCTTL